MTRTHRFAVRVKEGIQVIRVGERQLDMHHLPGPTHAAGETYVRLLDTHGLIEAGLRRPGPAKPVEHECADGAEHDTDGVHMRGEPQRQRCRGPEQVERQAPGHASRHEYRRAYEEPRGRTARGLAAGRADGHGEPEHGFGAIDAEETRDTGVLDFLAAIGVAAVAAEMRRKIQLWAFDLHRVISSLA